MLQQGGIRRGAAKNRNAAVDCASTASPFPSICKREFDAATRVPNEKPRTLNSMTALQICGPARRSGYSLVAGFPPPQNNEPNRLKYSIKPTCRAKGPVAFGTHVPPD